MADDPLDPEEAAKLLLARAGDSQWARETVALGLRAKAEGLRRDAARLEALAGRVVSGDLTVVPGRDNLGPMDTDHDETRALKISRKMTSGKRVAPEVLALRKAGLTPAGAASLCGTTRDMLKQAWAKGSQFRPIRPEWKKRLAKEGVPESTWRER